MLEIVLKDCSNIQPSLIDRYCRMIELNSRMIYCSEDASFFDCAKGFVAWFVA